MLPILDFSCLNSSSFNVKIALGSTIAAVNILNFRDNFLTLLPQEQNVIGKNTKQKILQRGPAKNLAPLVLTANKQTANQAFHDELRKLVLDSQLQNLIANLKQQVLEVKKVVL